MTQLQKKDRYNVAIAGVTGAVGEVFLQILEERQFPIHQLKLLASPRSAGKKITYAGKEYTVEALTQDSFADVDIALFSAGGGTSKEFAPIAAQAGAVVIDNSSAFRMDEDVPLVVPEVNPADAFRHKGIIANPNCTTIIMVVALKPLHDYSPIKRVVVSSYQSASGAGAKGMYELQNQTKQFCAGQPLEIQAFAHQLLQNVIPHIDTPQDNGYTREEMKMFHETRKIMGDQNIRVSATCVRVPVISAHSEAVTIETEQPISVEKARELLSAAPGIKVVDDLPNKVYPMPLFVAGRDDCEVGRIRKDLAFENGLTFWVVGDQLRKGAALNAIQIAELLIQK
ncbi:aspartate-semialdehyde dehydrogenase [Desulfurispirillum indicum S5]|uniref:Aspartate-semialdehyde dehydrogenase n=1 Tax=Desulfurispirillum indicum (strain ATCC BAA-1389 / DSM 22839 / S5) TaxID=653733 RepID=E6W5J5_DESIS|nr:aspartate-semialdehyde dehydrogenase [Desulfurispirillum indicum]ADU66026.1 aspartate-semialdehyde dehydrogenase [Desulfurispirillum indicum S5]